MLLVAEPNHFQVLLMTSSGTLPGNIIETITVTMLTSAGIVTANSALHPVLTAGTQYWLAVFAQSLILLEFGTLRATFSTPQALRFTSPTGPWVVNNVNRSAFQINGEKPNKLHALRQR